MNIKVLIPVETGGYTGQRDEWESYTQDYEVTIEDDHRLRLKSARSASGETIWFDLEDLTDAVNFYKQQTGDNS